MKGIDGGELNGPGLTVGIIAWLVIMMMVGVEKGSGSIMGVGGDALLIGIPILIVMRVSFIAHSNRDFRKSLGIKKGWFG